MWVPAPSRRASVGKRCAIPRWLVVFVLVVVCFVCVGGLLVGLVLVRVGCVCCVLCFCCFVLCRTF
jgi:hypothetical protein